MDTSLTFEVDGGAVDAFAAAVERRLDAAQAAGRAAMTLAFHGVVDANFGSTGFDRPFQWMPLSDTPSGRRYQRRVGRSFATLLETGALKGTLRADEAAGEVSMANTGTVRYAVAHHHGNPPNFGWVARGRGELPARRVFPLDPSTEQVTPRTAALVTRAAADAAREALKA